MFRPKNCATPNEARQSVQPSQPVLSVDDETEHHACGTYP
jgi:hypothetical protein